MKKTACISILLCSAWFAKAQDPSFQQISRPGPTAAGFSNFIDVPVNLYTGVPDIGVPLYTFPTHSKDISVGFSVNYHPAGTSVLDKISDVGRGWSLMAGGVVSRNCMGVPDEKLDMEATPLIPFDDIYYYSFMGHSGRFMILRDGPTAFHVEKMDDATVKIEYQFASGTYAVESFTIYDDKGYRYIFDKIDTGYVASINGGSSKETTAYNLTSVVDNNDKTIALFDYTTHYVNHDDDNPTTGTSKITVNKLNFIEAVDIGKAFFDYTYTDLDNDSHLDEFKLNSVTIKTPSAETVKKFVFSGRLDKISEYNSTLTEHKDYEFYYRGGSGMAGFSDGSLSFDPLFGYRKSGYDKFGFASFDYACAAAGLEYACPVSPYAAYGIMEKMVLPTGGSVLYEWERNTFSYDDNVFGVGNDTDETYYEENQQNNYTAELVDETGFDTSASGSWTFTVGGTGTRQTYFMFDHEYYDFNPGYEVGFPLGVEYELYSGTTLLETFGRNYVEDRCLTLGELYPLAPGTYTIQIVRPYNSTHTTGYIRVATRERNAGLKRWINGPGIRIKRMAYFDIDANVDYLVNPGVHPAPAKEINYAYNYFDDQSKSSGELFPGYHVSWDPELIAGAGVGYKNVKVWQTGNNGYEKYEFETAYTNDYDLTYFLARKNGMLLSHKIFDNADHLVRAAYHTYDYEELGGDIPLHAIIWDENYLTKATWPKLVSATATDYPDGNPAHGISTAETFTYNSTNRRPASKTMTDSYGETLKTAYGYHTGNSTYSQNRITEPDAIETSRIAGSVTTPISTVKTGYSNSAWGSGNVSYLPNVIQGSKGSNSLETKVTVGAYDEWSNPLWVQQENGIKVHYIWGYGKTQPVAKIENLASAGFLSSHVTAIQGASSESALETALAALYTDPNLSGAMITTYTYLPLRGIDTVTDPKGDTLTYEYDLFGRLRWVKDKDGNIVSKTEYNYK
jgi:YD repeat-containing protein